MGIFEKSIPKYVVNPVDNQIEVAPQDVYVDDIFDPIFNARVKDAMRQKYGGGLYGVAGGYSEMLRNAWGGDGGILGKGMGVLSTFGRSMEKADDAVLGILTEGVEGITGQGFDNPFKQIFVEDRDYTGKGLLAAMANSFRGLAGTTVTEEDFGKAWNIPALGIELGTDVGILGGGLAKKFAPAAKNLTSKELFSRLGKSDVKTTVGEVGQLMSNYDDLMSKVAIDATAPGLRPAFGALKNKLGEYFATHSAGAWADVEFDLQTVEDVSKPPEVREAARERLAHNEQVINAVQLFKEPDAKLAASQPIDFDMYDVGAEESTIDRLVAALQRDIAAESYANKFYTTKMDVLKDSISKAGLNRNKEMFKRVEESQKIADKFGWKPKQITDQAENVDVDRIRKTILDTIGGSWKQVSPDVKYTPEEEAFFDLVREGADTSEVYKAFPDIGESIYYKQNLGGYVRTGDADVNVNETYVGDVIDILNSDEALLDAYFSGTWSSNEAVSNAINKALHSNDIPVYEPSPYRVSPSELSSVNAMGTKGTEYAHSRLQRVITPDVKAGKLFKSKEEFTNFFKREDIQKALEKYIPAQNLSKSYREGLSKSAINASVSRISDNRRRRFIQLLSDVYFPKEGVDAYSYTKSLQALETFVSKYVDPEADEVAKMLKTLTREQRQKIAANPKSALPFKKFLENKGLISFDEYGNIITRTPGTRYLLYKTYEPSVMYNEKYRKAAQREAYRLKAEYAKKLDSLSEAAAGIQTSSASKFFSDLYDAVDAISMNYLQPLRDEVPHHLVGVDTGMSLDKVVKSDSEGMTTFLDILKHTDTGQGAVRRNVQKGVKSEYNVSPHTAVSNWVKSIVPNDATPEQLKEFAAPLADYLDIGYRTGVKVPLTDSAKNTVDTFYSKILPAVERLSSDPKYGSTNLGRAFSKELSGLDKLPKQVADDLKLLNTWLKDKDNRAVYNAAISRMPSSKLNYSPKVMDVSATWVSNTFDKPKNVDEILSDLKSARKHGMLFDISYAENVLNRLVDDLGTTRADIAKLFDKARAKGVKALTPSELGLYRAYYQRTSKVLSDLQFTRGRKVQQSFRLGDIVDLRQERFQARNFLKNFKGNLKDVDTVNLVNYGTVYSKSGREKLQDAASRSELKMNFIEKPSARLGDVYSEAFDRYRPTTPKTARTAREKVEDVFNNMAPEEVAENAYESFGAASTRGEEVLDEMSESMNKFIDDGGSDASGEAFNGPRKWRWFKIIKDALSVSDKNAVRTTRATLRTSQNRELGKRFREITARFALQRRSRAFKDFYILRQKELGDVVNGADFWTTFRRTGVLVSPYAYGSKQLDVAKAALEHNAELINKAAGKPIVEVLVKDANKSTQVLVMRFTGDKNTVKIVKKRLKEIENSKFADVVFSPPTALSMDERRFMDSEDIRELSGLMDELQASAADQAKYLGFQFDNATPYTHHAMKRDADTAEWLNSMFYENVSSEEYDDLAKLISDFDEYRKTDRGAFGSMLQDRRFRGDYWLLDNGPRHIFEYSPDRVFTSTLADGMFANLQYQDFTDLFINDNFKIKGVFNSVDDLKKVLYAKDSKGRASGNFANSELVSYKLDENGRISGLIKYDKATDAGLAKALADENTILVPANAISHMDNVLRKDIRMNNKFWSFVNKRFTIPFKFGLLSNPGFLLGNVSDATLKLATTMSQKYGTSLTRELSNVSECINTAQHLKNSYYDAFEVWKKVSKEYDIRLSPEATIPDIVAMSPKYKEDFLKWLNGDLKTEYTYQNEAGQLITELIDVPCDLSQDVINNASIWTMLQGVQMNSSKMREFADLAEISPESRFDVATNWFDRITQGSGKYDKKNFRTWGLFMNNPYMKKLTDASGAWEDIIRTSSILDDLRHGDYSMEDIAEFARFGKGTEDNILYRVRLDEAKNTMFNAQFDYERQSDFISKIGKTVPFPIFFLKNFEYWMELFAENPQYVDNAIDIQEGLWSGYNEDNDKFMTEAKGRGAIPVGGDALPKWFKGVYKPSPLQSMFGAFNLLNDPVDNLSYRVNPLISGAKVAAVEAMPDSDLTTLLRDPENVKYRPYSTDVYERNVKQGDPNFSAVNYTLHRMNPYERAINNYLRVPEKAEAGELQLSDALPSVFQPMF